MFFRQRLDGPLYLAHPRLIQHRLLHGRPGVGNLPYRLIIDHIVQTFLLPLVLAVAQRIQRQMRGDAEQPGRELRRRLIRSPRTIYPQENLLRQFFRHRRVLHHAIEEVDHGISMLLQQHAKAGVVAILDAKHQLGIVIHGSRKSRHIFLNPFVHPRLRSAGAKITRPTALFPLERSLHQAAGSPHGGMPKCSI